MFDLNEEARQWALQDSIDWEKITGSTVLITGATGLVGSTCARLLLERNKATGAGICVIGLVRSLEKATQMLRGYKTEDGLILIREDVRTVRSNQFPKLDYIIHAACPTASRYFMDRPVETADIIVLGTRNMLEVARAHDVKGFAFLSSMEVYGAGRKAPGAFPALTEAEVGYVNPLDVRSCYPEGKRMAEQYCSAFAHEYGIPAVSVRLAQTFGPGIPKNDARLFALCARSLLAGEDIVLKTTGESTRMYLYTMDAATAILCALLNGKPGAAYNAANPNTYSSVKEMADLVGRMSKEHPVSVRCEVDPNAPFAPEHHLPLAIDSLSKLGWKPRVDLPSMYRTLMAYLED